jgi:hypothetical protein
VEEKNQSVKHNILQINEGSTAENISPIRGPFGVCRSRNKTG